MLNFVIHDGKKRVEYIIDESTIKNIRKNETKIYILELSMMDSGNKTWRYVGKFGAVIESLDCSFFLTFYDLSKRSVWRQEIFVPMFKYFFENSNYFIMESDVDLILLSFSQHEDAVEFYEMVTKIYEDVFMYYFYQMSVKKRESKGNRMSRNMISNRQTVKEFMANSTKTLRRSLSQTIRQSTSKVLKGVSDCFDKIAVKCNTTSQNIDENISKKHRLRSTSFHSLTDNRRFEDYKRSTIESSNDIISSKKRSQNKRSFRAHSEFRNRCNEQNELHNLPSTNLFLSSSQESLSSNKQVTNIQDKLEKTNLSNNERLPNTSHKNLTPKPTGQSTPKQNKIYEKSLTNTPQVGGLIEISKQEQRKPIPISPASASRQPPIATEISTSGTNQTVNNGQGESLWDQIHNFNKSKLKVTPSVQKSSNGMENQQKSMMETLSQKLLDRKKQIYSDDDTSSSEIEYDST